MKKNVLVLGSGGREHAFVMALSKDENVDKLYCAPGNGGTEKISEDQIISLVHDNFDLTPYGIMMSLDLLQPIYEKSAAYGHFGRENEGFPWENTDKAEDLRAQSGL